ncbi:hypothetical protein AMTRI_Chr06g199110 [Amborella trichopoda]
MAGLFGTAHRQLEFLFSQPVLVEFYQKTSQELVVWKGELTDIFAETSLFLMNLNLYRPVPIRISGLSYLGKTIFQRNTKVMIGKGDNIFWCDKWLEDRSLRFQFADTCSKNSG